jgi:hypothetical protein
LEWQQVTWLNPYTSSAAMETAIVESAHDATEEAHRAWERSRDLKMLAEAIIRDIKRMCERTQVSIVTSRMILEEEVNPRTHSRFVGENKPANLGQDVAKTGKH